MRAACGSASRQPDPETGALDAYNDAVARAASDPGLLVNHLCDRATLVRLAGHHEIAEREYRRVIKLSRQIGGDRRFEGRAWAGLAIMAADAGRLDEARRLYQQVQWRPSRPVHRASPVAPAHPADQQATDSMSCRCQCR